MEQNPQIGLVFADSEEFDEGGVQCRSLLSTSRFYSEIIAGPPIDHAFQKLLLENFIPTSTVMVRRRCFETTGLFDLALKGPEDRDMWSRIAARIFQSRAFPGCWAGSARFPRVFRATSRPLFDPASGCGASPATFFRTSHRYEQ